MRERVFKLDILRIMACAMVVLMHAPLPASGENGLLLSAISYLTAPGVGLFFMVSGALLLPTSGGGKFFEHRFVRIVIPLVVWSVFYMLFDAVVEKSAAFSLQSLLSLPFSAQANPTFWFLYTLMGLYLIAPILSRWLQHCSRRELEFYLVLWATVLCLLFVLLWARSFLFLPLS